MTVSRYDHPVIADAVRGMGNLVSFGGLVGLILVGEEFVVGSHGGRRHVGLGRRVMRGRRKWLWGQLGRL